MRPGPASAVWLLPAAALVAALPLVCAGLLRATPLAGAFAATLALLVVVLPGAWAAFAPGEGRAGARLGELALALAGCAPALALSYAFSDVEPAAALAAGLATASLLVALGLSLAHGAPRSRPARVAAVLAWSAALPLALLAGRDLAAADAGPMVWLAPALAQARLLEAAPSLDALGAALAGGTLLPLASVAAGLARRRPAAACPRRAAAGVVPVALAALVLLAGPARASPTLVFPLLGGHVRAGEPWPLRLTLGADAPRFEVAARSHGTRFAVAVAGASAELAAGVELAAVPLGGAQRLELEARRAGGAWERLVTAPGAQPPSPVPEGALLVLALGDPPPWLAGALAAPRAALVVPLSPRDLPLLGRAGDAADLVVVGAGAAEDGAGARASPALLAFAAAGGAVACAERRDLLLLARAELGSAPRPGATFDVVRLGAGALLGPREDAALAGANLAGAAQDAAARAAAAGRLAVRARRAALEAAWLAGPAPAADPALGERAALAALAAVAALGLVAVPLRRRAAQPASPAEPHERDLAQRGAGSAGEAPDRDLAQRGAGSAGEAPDRDLAQRGPALPRERAERATEGVRPAFPRERAQRVTEGGSLAPACAAALVVALVLRLVAVPAGSVHATSAQILVVPGGGTAALRLDLLALASSRRVRADLRLDGGAALRPLFASPVGAIRAETDVLADERGLRLTFPASPQARRFARTAAARLSGPLRLTRDGAGLRVENATRDLPLTGVVAAAGGSVCELPDLPPGASCRVDLSAGGVRLDRYRLAAADPAERERRRLLAAALARFDPATVVVGASGPPQRLALEGAASEDARTLVLVTE